MKDGEGRSIHQCVYCGESKPEHLMERVRDYWTCAYCFSVRHGEPDARWIGVLDKRERLPGGFHRDDS